MLPGFFLGGQPPNRDRQRGKREGKISSEQSFAIPEIFHRRWKRLWDALRRRCLDNGVPLVDGPPAWGGGGSLQDKIYVTVACSAFGWSSESKVGCWCKVWNLSPRGCHSRDVGWPVSGSWRFHVIVMARRKEDFCHPERWQWSVGGPWCSVSQSRPVLEKGLSEDPEGTKTVSCRRATDTAVDLMGLCKSHLSACT